MKLTENCSESTLNMNLWNPETEKEINLKSRPGN